MRLRPKDRVLLGVCGGIADHLRIDAIYVRLGFVLLALYFGVAILAYVILWAVMDKP